MVPRTLFIEKYGDGKVECLEMFATSKLRQQQQVVVKGKIGKFWYTNREEYCTDRNKSGHRIQYFLAAEKTAR